MLYRVCLWPGLLNLAEPDITCSVDACSVEDAAQRAMWLYGLVCVAYASVEMVLPVPGVIARAWGPVVREVV